MSAMPDLLTVRQVAELLQLNEAHVRDRLSKRRDFPPAYRIGGLRWERADILAWIEAQRVSPASRRATRPAQRSRAAANNPERQHWRGFPACFIALRLVPEVGSEQLGAARVLRVLA